MQPVLHVYLNRLRDHVTIGRYYHDPKWNIDLAHGSLIPIPLSVLRLGAYDLLSFFFEEFTTVVSPKPSERNLMSERERIEFDLQNRTISVRRISEVEVWIEAMKVTVPGKGQTSLGPDHRISLRWPSGSEECFAAIMAAASKI